MAKIKIPVPRSEGDLFARLGDAGWESEGAPAVYFPLTKITTSFEQAQADHEFYGVDGSDIEPTGGKAVTFTAEIPFLNHIVPGPAERWVQPLYPTALRAFVRAMQARDKGILHHPEFGEVLCRPKSFNFSIEGGKRGGVTVSATWRQTLPAEGDADPLTKGASPIQGAIQAVLDLTASAKNYRKLVPTLPKHEADLKDFFNSLEAFGNSIESFGDRMTSPFKRIAKQASNMVDAFDRAGKKYLGSSSVKRIVRGDQQAAARSVLGYQGRAAARRLQVAVEDARQKATATTARTVRVFFAARDTSIASLSVALRSPVSELLELNPALCASPEVKARTVVRYYGRRL